LTIIASILTSIKSIEGSRDVERILYKFVKVFYSQWAKLPKKKQSKGVRFC